MIVRPAEAERFLASPPAALRAVLFYGPDRGLVSERARRLVAAVVEDPEDPFRLARLAGRDLKDDPARLADEAGQLSFTGGRRAVHVQEAGEESLAAVTALLEGPGGDGLAVLEAGELARGSRLRKLFEGEKSAAATVACYKDEAGALPGVIRQILAELGQGIEEEALHWLAARLGSDRGVTRRELEKLALSSDPAEGPLGLESVRALAGDSAEVTLEDLLSAVAEGRTEAAERALRRTFEEGANAVMVLRAAQRHFDRLAFVASAPDGPEAAMRRLRPPVFQRAQRRFLDQLRHWPPEALALARHRLIEAEITAKRTGMPDRALTGQALLGLAILAARRRR